MASNEPATRSDFAAATTIDTALLAACRAHNRRAQQRLYELSQSRVYRLLVRMVGWHDAADVMQEVYLQVFRKIDQFFFDVQLTQDLHVEDCDICVVAYGSVARSAELAVTRAREEGINAGLIKLKTLFPFPRRAIEQAMNRAKSIVVPEMNMGQMSREVKRVNNGRAKVWTINRVDGRIITPTQILKSLRKG